MFAVGAWGGMPPQAPTANIQALIATVIEETM